MMLAHLMGKQGGMAVMANGVGEGSGQQSRPPRCLRALADLSEPRRAQREPLALPPPSEEAAATRIVLEPASLTGAHATTAAPAAALPSGAHATASESAVAILATGAPTATQAILATGAPTAVQEPALEAEHVKAAQGKAAADLSDMLGRLDKRDEEKKKGQGEKR